jgi:hypothetical protein
MTVPAADLFSEKFGAMGNVVAEGVWNQLGRPELDRLTLLIRESVQNSWDARLNASIRFKIDAFSLTAGQLRAYGQFFENRPPSDAYTSTNKLAEPIQSLTAWLGAPGPRMLVISDRDTRGLDGPTRADDAATDGAKRNFVDFLRNVGQPPAAGRGHTGGTFGYGKAALYLASETRTILVHTRCRHRGKLESRLTAASLSHNYAQGRSRYTGRHWWGVATESDVIEPYVGTPADEIAAALGLPPFVGDETGTSIGITAPAFDDGELYEVGKICLRHLWPKLKAPNRGRPPISLSAKISGVSVPMPDPAKTPPYDAYWRAYCALHEKRHTDIKYYADTVGRLSLERALMLAAPKRTSTAPEHEQRPQHVALLRTPELVVKYLDAGRGLGNDQVGFAGVFKADEDFDDSFARSEPPTHDDWQASSVSDKRARGIVNTALKRIREHSREFASLNSPRVTGAEGSPLALLAREFSVLAPGLRVAGTNDRERSSSSEQSGGRRERKPRPQVRMEAEQNSTVEEVEGVVYAVFLVDVTHASGSDTTNVTAQVYSVLSGGARETESPFGKPAPRIGWWESPRGARVDGNPLRVGPRQQGRWKLFVPIEDNVAVAVEIDAIPEQSP